MVLDFCLTRDKEIPKAEGIKFTMNIQENGNKEANQMDLHLYLKPTMLKLCI